MKKMKVGVIGCGKICDAYFNGARMFEILDIVACSDLRPEAAEAKAVQHGVRSCSIEDLLADEEIDTVLNLTIPAAHAEVSERILNAGKNAYAEKPLAVRYEDGKQLLELAKEKNLLVGCAPDTFLGAGLQTCRKIIDDGWLGNPTSGTAFMLSKGPESWHPNPGFYYEVGGGPLFDMGPYYLTALVHLLGPIRSVMAGSSKAREQRIATCKEKYGLVINVEIPTHYSATIEFENGALITASFSFDVAGGMHEPIEIYGTEGSMRVPDPNTFGGSAIVRKFHADDWVTVPQSHLYPQNARGIGLADMAYSLLEGRPQRCSGDLALHVLEAMHSFDRSAETGQKVELETRCPQPEALPATIVHGRL